LYPSDDLAIQLVLSARRTRALQQEIELQLSLISALYERATAVSRHADACERAAEIVRDVRETVRTSRELVESAREHERRSRLLVQRSRSGRLARAAEGGG
jgi:vacuolar-type H+-ATPase subunit I/STV1